MTILDLLVDGKLRVVKIIVIVGRYFNQFLFSVQLAILYRNISYVIHFYSEGYNIIPNRLDVTHIRPDYTYLAKCYYKPIIKKGITFLILSLDLTLDRYNLNEFF